MSEHFDELETRKPEARERELMARLPRQIARARSQSSYYAETLAGVDPDAVTSRAALAKLPVLRKSDLIALQKETPPFGGYNAVAPGKARRILMSPGPIFELEGHEVDYAGVARALFAAHPGAWTWTVRPENPAALAFWRRVAPTATVTPEPGDDGIVRTRMRLG